MQPKQITVAVSGGFDPIRVGHVRLLEESRALGDRLVVIINNDNWLVTEKGFAFMPQEERAKIISTFPFVDEVVITAHAISDPDRSVSRELEMIRPDVFASSGDRRSEDEIPEAMICKKYGIRMVFNVGGDKIQSNPWLTNAIKDNGCAIRPWGQFRMLDAGAGYWVKTIVVDPGHRLSLQAHDRRDEFWFCVYGEVEAERGTIHNGVAIVMERKPLLPGDSFFVRQGEIHRLSSKKGGVVVEVALGNPDESDIKRFADDYERP